LAKSAPAAIEISQAFATCSNVSSTTSDHFTARPWVATATTASCRVHES
jgi:hypothetical protein